MGGALSAGMSLIRNPILPGFHPDPSICRVGDDYFVATSTFEWYPGVEIHHSRDLVNWRLVRRPLERAAQLDMRGNPDSCGVWAPCLSYADGLFWLVYTDVKRFDGNFKDAHNYIVTSPSIEGPWSDPTYVNSSGFDPSLFHDVDGRKWFVNMLWDHRNPPPKPRPHYAFAGILLQEWDAEAKRLIGEPKLIYEGSSLGFVEGPHLFRRGEFVYLIVAEGGTGYEHAVTLARSTSLFGPYETHPNLHVVTAKSAPDAPLQRAGHGQVVETPAGPYLVHLCSRPLPGLGRSPMGRETAIQKCVWGEDGWLYLSGRTQVPALEVEPPAPAVAEPAPPRITYDFAPGALPPDFQWLRTPAAERLFSLDARPGWLRLFGRESVGSWFEQALVARRQQHFRYRAEVELDFAPSTFQQAAGLVLYYNRHKFHLLAVTHDERLGRALTIMSCLGDWPEGRLEFPAAAAALPDAEPARLAVEVNGAELQCFVWLDGEWRPFGPGLDASLISDEAGGGEHRSFTGAFVGMMAFDVSGAGKAADFRGFVYEGRD